MHTYFPCQVFPTCNATPSGCVVSPCTYDYSRQGQNSAAFTVGADSNGANGFIGDIYESFRFQPNDPTVLWSVMSNLILPYLQVGGCGVCVYCKSMFFDQWLFLPPTCTP